MDSREQFSCEITCYGLLKLHAVDPERGVHLRVLLSVITVSVDIILNQRNTDRIERWYETAVCISMYLCAYLCGHFTVQTLE